MPVPEQFEQATIKCKANVYFDGKVVSHGLRLADGSEKTVGLIYPGEYHFNTNAPELMEVIAGECSVVLVGESEERVYAAGSHFRVPGNSGFDIKVSSGIMEYVCSFG